MHIGRWTLTYCSAQDEDGVALAELELVDNCLANATTASGNGNNNHDEGVLGQKMMVKRDDYG